jgi:lipoyl(octanoyl) transferase
MRECRAMHLGELPYVEAWALQRRIAAERSAGACGDTLLLTAHPHTFTLGSRSDPADLLVAPAELAREGVAVVQCDRGGAITYHGPGQIVGYPILKLSHYGGDTQRYLRMLEDVIIRTVGAYGVAAGRCAGMTGVWVGDAKIAAIGVRVTAGGVTLHGFAINIAVDLRYFDQIVPCGIRDRGVTSLDRLIGAAPPLPCVAARVAHDFGDVFGVTMIEGGMR